jgi:hypothetical protein
MTQEDNELTFTSVNAWDRARIEGRSAALRLDQRLRRSDGGVRRGAQPPARGHERAQAVRRANITEGRVIRYRGQVLTQAWGGHWNVTRGSDGGFCGGFKSIAGAKRWIDAQHHAQQ